MDRPTVLTVALAAAHGAIAALYPTPSARLLALLHRHGYYRL